MGNLLGTIQTALWLIVVLLAGGAGFWLAHFALPGVTAGGHLKRLRLQLGRSTRRLRCQESIRLTPQHTLHLVEWDSRRFMVACHPSGTTVLPDPAAEAQSQTIAAFAGAGVDSGGLRS